MNLTINCPNGRFKIPLKMFYENVFTKSTIFDNLLLDIKEPTIFIPFDKNIIKLLISYFRDGFISCNYKNREELINLLKYINRKSPVCEEMILQLQNGIIDMYGILIKNTIHNTYNIHNAPKNISYTLNKELERKILIIKLLKDIIKDELDIFIREHYEYHTYSIIKKIFSFSMYLDNNDNNDYNNYKDLFVNSLNFSIDTIENFCKKNYIIKKLSKLENGMNNNSVFVFIYNNKYKQTTIEQYEMTHIFTNIFNINYDIMKYHIKIIYEKLQENIINYYNNY